MRPLLCVAAISLCIAAGASADVAPPAPSTGASVCPIEKARDLFRRASEQYDRGEYEGALADFAACHRCRPQPALLFNIGQTQRKLRRYADAIDSLRAFRSEEHTSELQSR